MLREEEIRKLLESEIESYDLTLKELSKIGKRISSWLSSGSQVNLVSPIEIDFYYRQQASLSCSASTTLARIQVIEKILDLPESKLSGIIQDTQKGVL